MARKPMKDLAPQVKQTVFLGGSDFWKCLILNDLLKSCE